MWSNSYDFNEKNNNAVLYQKLHTEADLEIVGGDNQIVQQPSSTFSQVYQVMEGTSLSTFTGNKYTIVHCHTRGFH